MTFIKEKWRLITIGYLIITYLLLVVILHQPLSSFLIATLIGLALLVLMFLGTFMGVLGVLLQMVTKKEKHALPFFTMAYKLGTDNATILASFGLSCLRRNDPATALIAFKKGFDHTNYFLSRKTLMGNMAIAYWKMSSLDEAIELYQKIMIQFAKSDDPLTTEELEAMPLPELIKTNAFFYPQDYTTLGYLFLLKKDYERATRYTNAALSMKPEYASALDNLGQIAYDQKDFSLARDYFEKALDLNPNLVDSLYFMGLVELNDNQPKLAINYLTKASACDIDGLNTITKEQIEKAMAQC